MAAGDWPAIRVNVGSLYLGMRLTAGGSFIVLYMRSHCLPLGHTWLNLWVDWWKMRPCPFSKDVFVAPPELQVWHLPSYCRFVGCWHFYYLLDVETSQLPHSPFRSFLPKQRIASLLVSSWGEERMNQDVWTRSWQAFSVKSQTVNILGFVGHTVSVAAIQLWVL